MSIAPLRRDDYNGNKREIVPVNGESKIVRDKYSKALLLNDIALVHEHQRRSKERIEQNQAKEKLEELENSVVSLKEDVLEIKQMLKAFVNK
jgi:hypothetical protein